ncbi:hypothetical protein ME784_14660 [Lactobacillus delbrueckii]|nr:hypothetical protein ME784_14660 [Lactobacillus delbrueckii]GHN22724.1 hypothetical protein ME785_12820 [Lactobacillus delbrueckii]GHN62800.1 hypothetical protein ME807_12070 [Lactobacillus delbrueckii]
MSTVGLVVSELEELSTVADSELELAAALSAAGALVNFPGFLTKSVEFILHKATFRKQFYITCLL